jgi:ribosomal protein S18 acetylase RimI-like enzyme
MDEVTELTRTSGHALAAMMAGAPRLHLLFHRNASLILSREPLAVLNVLLIGPAADAVARLEASVETARQHRHPLTAMFTSHVAAALTPYAKCLGLVTLGEMPLMVLEEGVALTVSLQCSVERATDRLAIERAVALRAEGRFPIEPIKRTVDPAAPAKQHVGIFIGSRGGAPMSTVTVTQADDTVGIWWMATPAKHQHMGFGRSLLTQVIAEYRRRGASRFYLGGSEAGIHLYESLGFRTIGRYSLWMLDSPQPYAKGP